MDNENNGFSYTYSAKEQDEIKKIREKYVAKEESTIDQLRKLDKSVTGKATVVCLAVGIIGALLLGTGMSLTMVASEEWFIPGIVIGVIGIAIVSVNYPLYTKILKSERNRIAPEIIRLSDQLMK
ncbi:MAG: hypothetical protein IJB96_07180 [Lachnospira sp.]|nr:hypothetical protein [Lachnospira sp.]